MRTRSSCAYTGFIMLYFKKSVPPRGVIVGGFPLSQLASQLLMSLCKFLVGRDGGWLAHTSEMQKCLQSLFTILSIYATIVYNQSMPNMQPSNAKYAAIQCQICYTSGIVCTFGIGYEVKMALCAQMALYA